MNDLILYRQSRWFMGVLRSPMTRRLTLSHLLVVLLPAAVAFWLLQLHLDNRDIKRAQLTAEALLLAHVVEGRLPHRAPVDFVQADGVDLEGIFESITLRDGIEVIAFGPQGEQRTLTPGHSLEAQSVFMSLGAWPVWLGPHSPVVLDHLAEVHRHISLNTTTAVNQTKWVDSVIAAVIDAPAFPRAPQSQSIGEQIWVAIPILHRQEMVGGLALGYPGKARDLLAGRRILELALRLLFAAATLAIILSVVSARVIYGPINRMAQSLERFSTQLRRGVRAKDIPEPNLPQRRDSIGRLSAALRPAVATRGLGLTQLTPKVPVIIEGQPAAVGDILSAFLSNAIQRCAWGDEIRIWTRVQDRMVVVVVEDTGPPMPEGVNQCLCGAGDPAALRAQEVEGFTTGLAEAAQIVVAHSGVIRAEPVQPPGAGPAFGARFSFGLPV